MSDRSRPPYGPGTLSRAKPANGEPDVMNDLQRNYADLTQAQKRIAEAIVEDPEFVAFATVDKLSARLGIASSTIVRFAYRLGLDGYPELQEKVRVLVRSRMRSTDPSGTPDDGVTHMGEGVAAKSLSHDLENARRTIRDLDADTLDRAIELLKAARKIYFSGGLASDLLAEYAALTLDRIRGSASVLNAGRAAPAILDMTADDVLVVFSFPPYASHSLRIVEAALKQQVTVIGITDSPISPLGQLVDLTLTAHVSGIGPQNSLVAPMAIINVLLNGVVLDSPEASDRYRRIFELMDDWDTFVLKGDGDV
jgi:DNA-binding MurR/RpiR family transcriptional regulator